MSGTFQYRVNRVWPKSQANISAAVFFWELLKFVEAHSGLDFVAYGTGKVQTGTTPPVGWTGWDPAVGAVPWGDNSWFVFQATNADALLNGGGLNPWQCKAQVTLATGFDDCNVANTAYGQEGQTYICCLRSSALAGWNGTTLDFPATADENRAAFQGQDENFNVDFVGDDDTILWRGCAYDIGDDKYVQSRMGYVGMLQRRGTTITQPFFSMIGRLFDGASTLENATVQRFTSTYTGFMVYNTVLPYPCYSLWKDGTTRVQGTQTHKADPWHLNSLNKFRFWKPTTEDLFPQILLAQYSGALYYAILGEFRFLWSCGTDKGEGLVIGTDPQYLQVCNDSTAQGGILMKWPAGVSPVW